MALVDVIIGYAKGAQGDVGPQGPEGPQGPQGPQGPLPTLVNNALSTTPGVAALDAAMGKTLQDHIDTTNSNLALKANTSDLSAKFVDLIGLQKINTSAVTSDSFGNVVVSNAMGSVSVALLSCTRYISGADYALTVEDITTTAITIRARKITDGTVPPTGSSYGSLVFAKL